MLQKATAGGRGWDSPLDPDLREKFFLWASSIPLLANYPIPRWWNTEDTMDAAEVTWHYFADASKDGYGAVAYRRVVAHPKPPYRHGKVHMTIVMLRSHCVPLDSSRSSHHGSIPRLETTANTAWK